MDDFKGLTEDVLRDLETVREGLTDREAEQEMSVNMWIDRVRIATQLAHQSARAGLPQEEYQAWLEAAAAAIGRAEFVLQVWKQSGS